MSIYDKGYEFFPNPEGRLLELIIIDEESRGNWYSPTNEDVRSACAKFDLSFEEIDDCIRTMPRSAHTLLIDVPLYKKHRLIHPRGVDPKVGYDVEDADGAR